MANKLFAIYVIVAGCCRIDTWISLSEVTKHTMFQDFGIQLKELESFNHQLDKLYTIKMAKYNYLLILNK